MRERERERRGRKIQRKSVQSRSPLTSLALPPTPTPNPELCEIGAFHKPTASIEDAAAFLAGPGVVAASSFCRSPEVVREEAGQGAKPGSGADGDMRQNQVAKSVNRFVPYLFAVAGEGSAAPAEDSDAAGGGDGEDGAQQAAKPVGIVKVFEFWVKPPRLVEVARASLDGKVAAIEMSADLRYISVAMEGGALHVVTLPATVRPIFHAKSETYVHPSAMKEYQKLFDAGALGTAGGRDLGAAAASKNPARVPEEEEVEEEDDENSATEAKGADESSGGDGDGKLGEQAVEAQAAELTDADFVFTLKPTRNDVMHRGEEAKKGAGQATCHFILASVERKVAVPLVTLASLSEKERGGRVQESRAHGTGGEFFFKSEARKERPLFAREREAHRDNVTRAAHLRSSTPARMDSARRVRLFLVILFDREGGVALSGDAGSRDCSPLGGKQPLSAIRLACCTISRGRAAGARCKGRCSYWLC